MKNNNIPKQKSTPCFPLLEFLIDMLNSIRSARIRQRRRVRKNI